MSGHGETPVTQLSDEKERKGHGTDADEVKEILDVVSEKIPALLNSLTDVLYGTQQAEKYGKAVAGFYKNLKDSGMTDDQAFELTKKYMAAMSFPEMIGDAIRGGAKGRQGKVIDVQFDHNAKQADDEEE